VTTHRVRATWTGGEAPEAVIVDHLSGSPPFPASGHFGGGILTWRLPYLFRTPPGYNLLVRGPANLPKDGAVALEGLVETDWAVAPFTMNWRLLRPGVSVVFEPGEPVCMIVPQARGELERFSPVVRGIDESPETATATRTWLRSRSQFLMTKTWLPPRSSAQTWQGHYFHGTSPFGTSAKEHQRKLVLEPFREPKGMHLDA
jgi:hypothetical protein